MAATKCGGRNILSLDTVFKPTGPTVLIAATATQVASQNAGGVYMFRVINLATTLQRFSWARTAAQATALGGAAATALGTPNTIAMLGGSVETFEIPCDSFVIASTATGFEFTPGQGS
jgi:hypothetical protein